MLPFWDIFELELFAGLKNLLLDPLLFKISCSPLDLEPDLELFEALDPAFDPLLL